MDKYVTLEPDKTYTHSNGDEYTCLRIEFGAHVLERVSDGWVLKAHGVRMNEDGEIHWSYSSNGHWRQAKLNLAE